MLKGGAWWETCFSQEGEESRVEGRESGEDQGEGAWKRKTKTH